MPKKIAKKKKEEVMVLTPPMSSLETMDKEEKIAALYALLSSPGWKIIVSVIEENRSWLERTLIDGYDPETGEKLSPEEQDIIRDKIKLNNELIGTPEGYIQALKRSDIEQVTFDPYETEHL